MGCIRSHPGLHVPLGPWVGHPCMVNKYYPCTVKKYYRMCSKEGMIRSGVLLVIFRSSSTRSWWDSSLVAVGKVLCSGQSSAFLRCTVLGLRKTAEDARLPLLRLHKIQFRCRVLISHIPEEGILFGSCVFLLHLQRPLTFFFTLRALAMPFCLLV